MKTLTIASVISILSLIGLVAIYIDHFGRPFLEIPVGVASMLMLSILAVNLVIAGVALTLRRRGEALAWSTTALSLAQAGAVLMTS